MNKYERKLDNESFSKKYPPFKAFDTSPAIRLETYRKNASDYNLNNNLYSCGVTTTWKDSRYPKPAILKRSSMTRSEDGTKFYVDSPEDFPGTLEGDAHEISRHNNVGWYTDNFQDGILKGAVISIHASKKTDEDGSHKLYMPATYHTDWDGATVYNDFYDSKEDAARAADHYAEREAETCREDDAKFQAFEVQVPELKERIHTINKETLALIKEIKSSYTPRQYPSICRTLRRAIEKALDDRREAFERIEALKDNYWLAVE